jgi:hypothetical protein
MGIKKQDESDKIAGDKYESAVDRAATGGPGGKRGQTEPDEEAEELELEEDENDVEETDDE